MSAFVPMLLSRENFWWCFFLVTGFLSDARMKHREKAGWRLRGKAELFNCWPWLGRELALAEVLHFTAATFVASSLTGPRVVLKTLEKSWTVSFSADQCPVWGFRGCRHA
ncbi:unnamed protein product [Ectocarpus sp. 13 AM-2016]